MTFLKLKLLQHKVSKKSKELKQNTSHEQNAGVIHIYQSRKGYKSISTTSARYHKGPKAKVLPTSCCTVNIRACDKKDSRPFMGGNQQTGEKFLLIDRIKKVK